MSLGDDYWTSAVAKYHTDVMTLGVTPLSVPRFWVYFYYKAPYVCVVS